LTQIPVNRNESSDNIGGERMVKDQEQLLYLNGLDATTGHPLVDPVSRSALTERVLAMYTPEQRHEEQETYGRLRSSLRVFDEYVLDDPAQAGWGLLVHADEADAMKEQLAALISHRGGRVLLYRGESAREWKEKHQADAINPERFPHYVLVAGSPSRVPYELQFSLDVLQAVGRIDFDDPADYARYAQTVVNQETGQTPAPAKRIVFFAPQHDYATDQSSRRLVRPLLTLLPKSKGLPPGLGFDALLGDEATKANLLAALKADESGQTPAVLFSASHGIGVKSTDPDQRTLQGSIVCQDNDFPLTPKHRKGFVSGYDVADGFRLPCGIHFFFACYGAGTRAQSDFADYVPTEARRQRLKATRGKEDFVAYLPKALLVDPTGGALAVVGHVDPTWVHSFESPTTRERRIYPFGFTLAQLLRGKPVGFAVNAFNQKYTDYSTDLLNMIKGRDKDGQTPDPADFADLWICRNDAQNYVTIGDPAVRLRFD
jgi:hypothetical protein